MNVIIYGGEKNQEKQSPIVIYNLQFTFQAVILFVATVKLGDLA